MSQLGLIVAAALTLLLCVAVLRSFTGAHTVAPDDEPGDAAPRDRGRDLAAPARVAPAEAPASGHSSLASAPSALPPSAPGSEWARRHGAGLRALVLEDAGARKIAVIKEVRTLSGLSLLEAKNMVDRTPSTVLEGLSDSAAAEAGALLEAAGAKVSIR